MGLELVIPDCHEADMVLPRKRYFGGHEGDGEYIWYRTKNMLHGPDLSGISDADENITVCGRNL